MCVTHVLANKSAVVPNSPSPEARKATLRTEGRLLKVGDCWSMVANTMASEPSIRAVAVVYLITLIHHIYGGLVFGSVERLILALVFTILFVATAWLSRLTAA